MPSAIENVIKAQKLAMSIRPKVGGFPYLAEVLRLAGVLKNIWYLPSCQSMYFTTLGVVVNQGTPLINGMENIPSFDKDGLIRALRKDQAGEGTFPEFLQSAWQAGMVRYEVDLEKRHVTYYGIDESYVEEYPAVEVMLPR